MQSTLIRPLFNDPFMKQYLLQGFLCLLLSGPASGQGIDSAWMARYTAKFSTDIGTTLPDIPLVDPEGKKISLQDFKGRTLYINIWATSCAPCLALYPKEQALMENIREMGLADSLLFVNICTALGSDKETWKKIVNSREDNALNFYSPDSSVFMKWKMNVIWPSFVLVDQDGKCLGKKVPSPSNAGIPFMLLAATKSISAKDAFWLTFENDKLLRNGDQNIHPLYLNYLEKFKKNYVPYLTWLGKQKGTLAPAE